MSENSDENICGFEKENGEPCRLAAGWGTNHVGRGRCRNHPPDAGAPEGNQNAVGNDGGAPEGNTNAVSHGLFAEINSFYQDVLSEQERELCDAVYEDYLADYREVQGDDPRTNHRARLFEIAVNHLKIIHSDNWATDKPSDLESGNPMVDRETRKKSAGEMLVDEVRYRETVVVGTQQKLRREDRAWLKDMGLLDDPESQKADAIDKLGDGATLVFGGDSEGEE